MSEIQKDVEQFVSKHHCITTVIEVIQSDLDALLRQVVEECCDSFTEVFLMNIANQTPTAQKAMLDVQIKAPFRWLLEGD